MRLFGISPAPEVFKSPLDQALEGLRGVYIIADDILVTGEGQNMNEAVHDHDEKVNALVDRCIMNRIKLNKDKLRMTTSDAKYNGHVLTAQGIKLDPAKEQSILQMERPGMWKVQECMLGMVDYLPRYSTDSIHR